MKRVVNVQAGPVAVKATLDLPTYLTRKEAQLVRDVVADNLLEALTEIPYVGVPLNQIRVRP